MNKSAITDHINSTNHVIDWEGAKIIDKEGDQKTRQIKKAIHIRLQGAGINRDEGAHSLPWVYDPLFATIHDSGGKSRRCPTWCQSK